MKNKLPENNSTRLASLDILRGFDLFLLVFFQPVFAALVRQMNLPFLNGILYQFDHEVWEGFRFWDLVMPLFLFMTGASMPFSLSKYIGTTGSYWPVYRRILKRVILLFIFGMIVQGNLLGLDSQHLYLYSNTLQSIAVGYPSLPDQSVNFLLDELLDMKQIGISLTENGAMYPHASVCGLMFSHPASEYFSVGKIGEDQLEDYTRRRGKSIEEMRKFLATNLQ